ncbi:hypothetical protein Goe26_01620 [Bacillus phage vB_BsuM-Goe26]|nr:hypothetical protein Goe26_01620 [Bacillus phage vB_BsuM-Goe26]
MYIIGLTLYVGGFIMTTAGTIVCLKKVRRGQR